MAALRKKRLWLAWLLLNLMLGSYYAMALIKDEKSLFLPGETTSGHYQIELACDACHGESFAGTGVLQKACVRCHAEELKQADDSHPKSKFTDPRNADRTAILDARACITCHKEHAPRSARAMGVTLPDDFCALCHAKIEKDRPSHQNMDFNNCAAAGCHNFHDNQALYEDFLVKHLDEPDTFATAATPQRNFMAFYRQYSKERNLPLTPLAKGDAGFADSISVAPQIIDQWAGSGHAGRGVNCGGCHGGAQQKGYAPGWLAKPGESVCENCHELELAGFYAGKHGMRLAQELPPMTVPEARQAMAREKRHNELSCSSCHGAHEYRTARAAVDSCMNCHKDGHTLAYKKSKHYALWSKELAGSIPGGSGVSCATCHLPRVKQIHRGIERVVVQHNQNANLRPNEKMIRDVCMNCHGLGFAIDALADSKLIEGNFQGRPGRRIESLRMARAREIEQAKKKRLEGQK